MADRPVLVVGGGLAGLACARGLRRHGIEVEVLEGSEAVGGRVRSDRVGGFTLDRGFQVLNTAYPALRSAVDLDALDLRLLPRGVRIHRQGRLHEVPHPLSSPTAPLRALRSGATGLRGKAGLARYVASLLTSPPEAIKLRHDLPAIEAWAEEFSDTVVAEVLTPFLSGVVLEAEPTASRVFTDLMMRMFARGSSAVPAAGMGALPAALAAALPGGSIRLGARVLQVHRDGVVLEDGSERAGAAVVVATDPWTAHGLLPGLGEPPAARGVTTHYFAADPWPGMDGTLVVDADPDGVTNSVVLSVSAPEYSGDGRALIATSTVHGTDGAAAGPRRVRRIAAALHGVSTDDWEHLAGYDLPRALPAMTAPHPLRKPVRDEESGVWVAGDHRDTSSLQGALVSGRRTATAVLESLTAGRRVAS